MTDSAILLTTPARHLYAGDKTFGFSVSQRRTFPDGTQEFKFVVPFTGHSMTVTVREQDLDAVLFPLTARGDAHSPSERNLLLGLQEDLHKPVYTRPEPVAVYPVGTPIGGVKHFDRSTKVGIECPTHPGVVAWSKDPFVSSWFSEGDLCVCPLSQWRVAADYKPTRNG